MIDGDKALDRQSKDQEATQSMISKDPSIVPTKPSLGTRKSKAKNPRKLSHKSTNYRCLAQETTKLKIDKDKGIDQGTTRSKPRIDEDKVMDRRSQDQK